MADALIPVKSLALAKSRLGHMLSSSERRGLALAMLEDVLGCLRTSAAIERIYLIGRDPEAHWLAQHYEAHWLFDHSHDLNSALRFGASYASQHAARHLLLLHADLPLIRAEDIHRLAMSSEHGAAQIVLAPSRDGGTNALACAAPLAIPLCFGRRSLAMHLEAARRRAMHTQLVCSPSLRDIDRPEDLIWLMEQKGRSRAQHFVRTLNVIERAACA